MAMIKDWPSMAACQSTEANAMLAFGGEQNVAKKLCRTCPVRYECLADALDNRIDFGVWGGMTERERKAILNKHPQVESWRNMFEAAMRKQVRSTTASRDVQDEFAALQESMTANEYAACYQRERLPLVKFLIYRGAAPQDAFDAAQHAFVEAWRRWEQIHNPRTWLRTVAIRAVAKANQPTVPLNEQYDLADSAPLGSQVSEETMDLVAVLRRLPPLQREIMVWTIDGFTPSEIAKELGISAEAQTRGIRAA